MSVLESTNPADRGQDVRLLENNSPRSLFVCLLLLVFLLGANFALTIYEVVRLHHFRFFEATVLPVLGIIAFRLARVVYRQLGR